MRLCLSSKDRKQTLKEFGLFGLKGEQEMAVSVRTEVGLHGGDVTTPNHQRSWDPNTVHLKKPAELVALLEDELSAIMLRCHTTFCQATLMLRSRPAHSSRALTFGADIPDLLFCPQCGSVYLKKALRELRPLLHWIGRALDQFGDRNNRYPDTQMDADTRRHLLTIWDRVED